LKNPSVITLDGQRQMQKDAIIFEKRNQQCEMIEQRIVPIGMLSVDRTSHEKALWMDESLIALASVKLTQQNNAADKKKPSRSEWTFRVEIS
jgi:hypothetical protein